MKELVSYVSQEYEFTIVHEIGHAVCTEHFPTKLPLTHLGVPLQETIHQG